MAGKSSISLLNPLNQHPRLPPQGGVVPGPDPALCEQIAPWTTTR